MKLFSLSPFGPHLNDSRLDESSPTPREGSHIVLGASAANANGGISSAGNVRPEPSRSPSDLSASVETPSKLNDLERSTITYLPLITSTISTWVSCGRTLGRVDAHVSPTFTSHTSQ